MYDTNHNNENEINIYKDQVASKGTKFRNMAAIKILAMMAIISLQFLLFPINASQAGSGGLSFATAQHPTITISVQNYTDIQGHNDILTATTSYSNDQLSLVIDNHVSKFGIGSLTFNLSVLPIGTYYVGACDKQAEFCSTLKTITIKGAPAPSAPPPTQPPSSSSTSNKSTSSSSTTSNTQTATVSTSAKQPSSSGTSNNSSYTSAYNSNTATSGNTTSKNTTLSTRSVSTYQNNTITNPTGTNNTGTSNTTSANTITTTTATNQSKPSNSSTSTATTNSTTTTGTSNASSQQSGNTTTTSLSGGVPVSTVLPVLLGIAIAIALGYTVLNNRKKGAQGSV